MKTRLKVLLANPEKHKIFSLAQNLELHGYHAEIIDSFENVIARQKEFDVILADITFPLDSCRDLLSQDEKCHTFLSTPFPFFNLIKRITQPVLIYTAYRSDSIINELKYIGLPNITVLRSPLLVKDIIEEINIVLQKSSVWFTQNFLYCYIFLFKLFIISLFF